MTGTHRVSLPRHLLFSVLMTAMIVSGSAAQSPTNAPASQIWLPAAQIHEIRNQFVSAIGQLAEALSGTFGDEGRQLLSRIDALARRLAQWDDAIRGYEAVLGRTAETAEAHVALGTVYLDRHRVDDALRELTAAGRLDSKRADVHGLSAMAFVLENRLEEAADSLRRASALDGGNPITLYALAQDLIRSGRREEARAALRTFHESLQSRVTQVNVQPSAPFERASLLRQVSDVAPIFPLQTYRNGFRLLLTGSYDRAVAAIRRAAADDPIVVDSRQPVDPVAEAGAALRRGQLQEALTMLEAAVVATPNRSQARRILGAAYWADGQSEKSVAELRAAIRLSPRDERSRIALADVLIELGRGSDAEQVLGDGSLRDSGAAHYRLGQLYQTRTLLPRAIEEFEAAAARDPLAGVDRLYETIGGLYSSQANFDASVDAYVKRIDVNPNHAEGHLKLGEIYFLQGGDDEALAEFLAALLIDPRNSGALAGVSRVYARTGRYGEAVETAKQASALDARHAGARYALATSLLRLGRSEEGKRELEAFQQLQAEAIASAQRESELKTLKMDAARHVRDGDVSGAAPLLRQALTYDPSDAAAHRDLAVVLIKSGQFEQAIVTLEQALERSDDAEARQLLANAYKAVGRMADSEAQIALSARAKERIKEERLRKMSGSR